MQYWLIDIGLDIIPDILYIQFELLIVPVFYLFIVEYLSKKLNHSKAKVFFPFAIGMVFQVFENIVAIDKSQLYIFHLVLETMTIVYNIALILICFVILVRYNKEKVSLNIKLPVKWMIWTLSLGLGLCIVWIISTITYLSSNNQSSSNFYPLWISISALIFFIGHKATANLEIWKDRISLRSINQTNLNKTIPKQIVNEKDKSKTVFNNAFKLVREQRQFLNPSISLREVAQQNGISPGYLSQIISKNSTRNFNELINDLRLKEAERMLLDHTFDNYSIDAIGLEAGFKSRSTFFSHFKKVYGISPNQFKKNRPPNDI